MADLPRSPSHRAHLPLPSDPGFMVASWKFSVISWNFTQSICVEHSCDLYLWGCALVESVSRVQNDFEETKGKSVMTRATSLTKLEGGIVSDDTPLVPIVIVTDASQLPVEFLEPSPEKKLVIGFDCEGVDLCRTGALCIMQLAFPDAIYLVDAIEGGNVLIEACKPALESGYVTKVIHDCKRDSEALYFQFGIKLQNVMDTQIAYSLIEEQEGRPRRPDDYISFVSLLADARYCGMSYLEKEEVRVLLRKDPQFWKYRPLNDLMIRAAGDDVRFLLHIYHKMMEKLNSLSEWKLTVRGALYCRCFCVDDNNSFADWPPLPSIPSELPKDDTEEETISVLEVPPGKMGCIIGRKGATILSIKDSCNAEIVMGGERGPPNKVITIGPEKQVRKAEAMLRGRMQEM